MAKTAFNDVASYLETKPSQQRKVLEQVRRVIRKVAPDAEEVISYQIPAYKIEGQRMISFAGWARHFSLYPVNERDSELLGGELEGYVLKKGTVQFSYSEKPPLGLIAKIARLRMKEAISLAKVSAKKKR